MMIENSTHIDTRIYFSCWSRKGYAIFAGLGRNVRIAHVPVCICECALLKSAQKGIIVTKAGCVENEPVKEQNFENEIVMSALKGDVCADENSNKSVGYRERAARLFSDSSFFN